MQQTKNYLTCLCILFNSLLLIAQNTISGSVKSTVGEPIENAVVYLFPSKKSTITDAMGMYSFTNVKSGDYQLNIRVLGYRSLTKAVSLRQDSLELNLNLEKDVLELETVVVTGSFEPRRSLESSTAVSVLGAKEIQKNYPQGTANLLRSVPGTFTDTSAGEVFTKVYTRGVSASAEDDMGWYYVSLQEDGLPVSLIQHSYFSPDLFHRVDLNTKKVEAIRGGSAVITALNAPGGIYNFISHGVRSNFGGDAQISTGIRGNGNVLSRFDISLGGPLGNNWFFNAGGHYRKDEGARDNDFPFSSGGQFKASIVKKIDKGVIKFYTKLLDDKTNRYTGVAAKNWNDPVPAFGQNFNSTSLLMPSFDGIIPDGRNLDSQINFNPTQGVHAKDNTVGFQFTKKLNNGVLLKNHAKYSRKHANWQTSISNAFVSLSNPLAYFISGAGVPVGQVVFKDALTGNEVARGNNLGILSGGNFQYLSDGRLPNDAIMGTSAWYKDNEVDEWINQFELQKEWDTHTVSAGFVVAQAETTHFTQGTFGYVTYEPNPKMLAVTLENPDQDIVKLSDKNGLSNGLFFENAQAKVNQFAVFLNDKWQIDEKLYADIGLRFEKITHKGSKDRSGAAEFEDEGGIDANITTAYNNNIIVPSGVKDRFDFDYSYLSYSVGLNYSFNPNAVLYSRFSKGNKAPELNYYFNNFSNVPINAPGKIQEILQAELGLKHNFNKGSFAGTVFLSELNNIGISSFEFDDTDNKVFYTPIPLNTSQTFGFEWESVYAITNHFTFTFDGILQNPKAKKWEVYDANGSVDVSDDKTINYNGNILPFNPKLMYTLGVEFAKNNINSFFNWQYMGNRYGNVANAFELKAYSVFDMGIEYNFFKNISLQLLVTNVFNGEGIANFFGANNFGASANGATKEFIANNPDSSFVVVPILPRSSLIKLNYTF